MQPYRAPLFGNLPPVIKNLLIINILLFIADAVLPQIGIDLTRYLGLHNIESQYFKPFQFVSHMFMHADLASPSGIAHIFFNMFALVMFGRVLEVVWGQKRFLIYYFVTGLGAAALHSFVNYLNLSSIQDQITAFSNTPSAEVLMNFVNQNLPNASAEVRDFVAGYSMHENDPSAIYEAKLLMGQIYNLHLNIPTVGASGAVFGVLLAFGMLFPNMRLMLIFPPIPIKAKYLVAILGLVEFFAIIRPQAGDNVAHFAHLGGMIFGFLLIKYWNKKGVGNYDRF